MKYLAALARIVHKQIILPFQESHAPVSEVSLGTSIGLIWSMTPLIGIQMYLGFATWVILRIFRIRFYLPIAIAMIWITNPVTLPFFYYIFYILGKYSLMAFGIASVELDFNVIYEVMAKSESMDFLSGLWYWSIFLLDRMGLPMFVGGFVVGLPSAIIGYPLTYRLLNSYRSTLAEKEGITLREWEERHVRKDIGLFSARPSLNQKEGI
ncbi:PF09835 family protein [Leptospira inadai serovar Lyme str. 10]|uniref:PF09835 family protein n=2 Tax=Leptospira inadai serovar Lyme TaxID=293084 RepID=V6H8C1_9LEPT|nr:DUF2062 domain-containing protein [Leptospira inadai]EQA34937.1 PF09835 family protein [Leptospira inadai serovar Lyme str. 10]PNV72438.1 DUF2062 domain-containing protein [Leptospira inadai serovar Lyme]